jgi:serine/threonine protein kinase
MLNFVACLSSFSILLDADFHIKLTDFGSAKVFPVVGGKVSRNGTPTTAEGEFFASLPSLIPTPPMLTMCASRAGDSAPATPKPSFVGTAEYVSPEVLLNDPTTES